MTITITIIVIVVVVLNTVIGMAVVLMAVVVTVIVMVIAMASVLLAIVRRSGSWKSWSSCPVTWTEYSGFFRQCNDNDKATM